MAAQDGYLFFYYTPNLASGFASTECKGTPEAACSAASGSYHVGQGNVYCTMPENNAYGTLSTCPVAPDPLGLNTVDPSLLAYMFGSVLLFWVIGLGFGLVAAQLRKAR
ncbi:MAG: hypothetical protein PHE17_07325 [Thiothrix sp.]|uniref:hypothetical protein n=1 Tax=Thiothrix sp. TaxID=1032 RepID=UPI0026247D48|nr:hypothetical protein [Thiothrix sp.]MDD5392815.1 hypothetical protein [Thiothrix sp.]